MKLAILLPIILGCGIIKNSPSTSATPPAPATTPTIHSGYTYDGKSATCTKPEGIQMCTEEYRYPEDAFPEHCKKNGGVSLSCGCHSSLCSINAPLRTPLDFSQKTDLYVELLGEKEIVQNGTKMFTMAPKETISLKISTKTLVHTVGFADDPEKKQTTKTITDSDIDAIFALLVQNTKDRFCDAGTLDPQGARVKIGEKTCYGYQLPQKVVSAFEKFL